MSRLSIPSTEAAPLGRQITAAELAEALHVSSQTLRKLTRRPGFPRPARAGRRLLYDAADVSAYLERQRQEGGRAD